MLIALGNLKIENAHMLVLSTKKFGLLLWLDADVISALQVQSLCKGRLTSCFLAVELPIILNNIESERNRTRE